MYLTMTVLIVASERDRAGLNITSCLTREYGFDKSAECSDARVLQKGDIFLARTQEETIYFESADAFPNTTSVIFASRHTSEKGDPCLTVHCTGNVLNEAPYGGQPRSLALVEPNRMRTALLSLSESRGELGLPYLVSLEATHHGPTELTVPCMFVEIGSSEKQWEDTMAGEAVARAIWKAANSPANGTAAVGFGGGHYSWKHTDAVVKGQFAFGHILSKYFFNGYDPAIVQLAFHRTVGECSHAVIDKKGVRGSERNTLVEFLKKSGREIVMI
jgi:D-aminoacyl-tRNA deacylase